MENWQSKSLNGSFKYFEGAAPVDRWHADTTGNIVGNDEGQLTFPRSMRAQERGWHPSEEGSFGQTQT